jgi:hypothetical protein
MGSVSFSGGAAVETPLFTMPGRGTVGDIIYNSISDTYIIANYGSGVYYITEF